MLIGYARVSTQDQTLNLQIDALEKIGCSKIDLDAVVRLKSGETLVLAGIIRSKEGVDDRGVPWIRKIPFLGNFFTKKEKTKTHTELAIFITPTLIDDSEQIAIQRDSSEKRLEKAGANLKPEPQTSSSIKEP